MEKTINECSLENVKKIFDIEKSDKKDYVWVASKNNIDRDDDIVSVKGIDIDNFTKNPVILFNHNREKPIGMARKVWKENDELKIEVEFASTPFAREIKTLVDEGVLSAMSINFIAKDWNYIKERDGYDILKSELLESSIVSVPANQEALLQKYFDEKNRYKLAEALLSKEEVKEIDPDLDLESMKAILDKLVGEDDEGNILIDILEKLKEIE